MFKVRDKFLLFSPPMFGEEEKKELLDTLDSGWITTGPRTKQFEADVAKYVGAKYAVGAFSCTSALHLAVTAIGISEGDEVITTPLTFASSAHVVGYHRAKPVFVDVDPKTLNIDPTKIEEKINSKTKALMIVHYGGQACDMDPILALAKKHKLKVIEDAAHAIGTEYKGKKIGSIGDITCFSFYATKNIATAEGGMAVTDNEEWAETMRQYTMYGISDAREIWGRYNQPRATWDYDVKYLGYKCNMMDIVAALGIHQLKKLDYFIKRRGENRALYDEAFGKMPELQIPYVAPYTTPCWHLYPLLLNLDKLKIDRNQFIQELRDRNVGVSVMFRPLHMHSYYRNTYGFREGDFPVAENIFSRIMNLPVSPAASCEDIKYVVSAVKDIVENNKK